MARFDLKSLTLSNAIWLLAYLATIGLLTWGLFTARHWALESYDTQQSRAEWEAWRRQTQQLADSPGPVARRPAKSVEPPTIVLLRDYFAACLTLLLLLSSVLFATFVFMIRGVARERTGSNYRIETIDDG
jgi:hypothetical protein